MHVKIELQIQNTKYKIDKYKYQGNTNFSIIWSRGRAGDVALREKEAPAPTGLLNSWRDAAMSTRIFLLLGSFLYFQDDIKYNFPNK